MITKQLQEYRKKPYSELKDMIGTAPETSKVLGESGCLYQIEIHAFWDGKPNGNIRVMGSIDDGGVRAFIPVTDDFIKSPNGQFIGE